MLQHGPCRAQVLGIPAPGGSSVAGLSRHALHRWDYERDRLLFAPAWGRLSDRRGRRGALLVGLFGFGGTMLVFSLVENVAAVYAERFLSGMFASAVTPVASAVIADLAPTPEKRSRRLALVSVAGIGGFLLGPTPGGFIARAASQLWTSRPAGSLAVPLAATAALAFVAAFAVGFAVPGA